MPVHQDASLLAFAREWKCRKDFPRRFPMGSVQICSGLGDIWGSSYKNEKSPGNPSLRIRWREGEKKLVTMPLTSWSII